MSSFLLHLIIREGRRRLKNIIRLGLGTFLYFVRWLMIVTLFLSSSSANLAFAQGFNIPAGSTLNLNSSTLNLPGNLDIDGSLVVTTGTVSLTGNWDNAGTFTAGTGTVNLTRTVGTQTVNSGGTGAGRLFYNLIHNAAGTAQLITNHVEISNNFANSAGTFDANGRNMTVAKDWTNTATFTANNNTVTLNGTLQTIYGNTTFYNLSKTVAAADTLIFEHSTTQTITHAVTLQGAVGQLLTLNSSDDDLTPTQFDITLNAGGSQTFSYLRVKNSDASGGLTLVAGTTSTDLGNDINWIFGGTTLTWEGDVSTDWSNPFNWDLGFVPGAADTAVVPAAPLNQPTLTAAASVANLTINTGASVSLAGFNMTISGTLSNDGTVNLFGSESVSIGTPDINSGLFNFTGDGDVTAETFTIPNIGATDYFNVTFNDPAPSDTFQSNAAINIAGALTITSGTVDFSTNANTLSTTGTLTVNGGTLTATNGNIDANGNVVISSGTLTAPTTGQSFTVAGNFTHSGGTFTHSSGTVTLDGTNQSLSGNTTFYNLTKAVTTAATLTFDTASTQTVANALTLTGAVGQLLSIVSSTAGVQAGLTLQAGGTQTLDYLDVRDSNAGGGLTLIARHSQQPSGNNTNWVFGGTTLTWDGSTSTNWNVASNWDLGLVPTDEDTAVIPNVANDPILTVNARVENLTMNAGGSVLALAGFNLTVDATLSNDGDIRLFGNETVSINTNDTNSGTFTYVGNGSASTRTIVDLGATDYYNLVIDGTGATPDIFRTNSNITAANNVTVTTSTMDISTNANTLAVGGTLTVNGGTLTATNGNIDANGAVTVSSGTLTAPGSGQSFTIATNFTHSGGTFTHSSGTVTFDTAAAATIAGDTTFHNFTSTTAGKTINFTAGSTQTVNGTFSVQGAMGNLILLQSTVATTDWNINFPNGTQSVQFVNVIDSEALGNDITCFSCTNGTGNDDLAASPHWVFSTLAIIIPEAGKTTDTTPTIIGTAFPASTVTIRDINNTTIATVVADANGNFMVEATTATTLGANSVTPISGVQTGAAIAITVVASPTSSQQPVITSHADGQRVYGANPTFLGLGQASQALDLRAEDTDGDLLLQVVGSGSVDAGGNFSQQATTSIVKGHVDVSVTVDGVASDVVSLLFTDPFGVVFDSSTSQLINNATVTIRRAATGEPAVVGTDLDPTDVNPVVTGSDGFYSFLAADGNYYITVEAEGYDYPSTLTSFPNGRTIVTGSKGETFTVAGVIIEMDHPVDFDGRLLRLEKTANKTEARVGDVVTYSIDIENQTATQLINVFIEDNIPPGFKYLNNRVTLDGVPIAEPSGNRPLLFHLGTIPARATQTLKYQLVVGSGVTPGDYNNSAVAKYPSGQTISNRATQTVDVVLDPLFDMGTIIGKVFLDRNGNGIQDEPTYDPLEGAEVVEDPIPNAQLVMEDGTVVTADKEGRFSVPSLTPGRHLLRLDERTLPEGSYLTTPKVVILDVTPGLLSKINFGVSMDYERFKSPDQQFFSQKIRVNRSPSRPTPRLNATHFERQIPVYNDIFLNNVEFRIFMNYAPFISKWQLKIMDKDTKKLVRLFEGDALSIHDPVLWDGKDLKGERVDLKKRYEYVVSVEDKSGKYDETHARELTFNVLADEKALEEYTKNREATKQKDYEDWIASEHALDNKLVQTILVDGESVTIDRQQVNLQNVRVLQKGALVAEFPLLTKRELTAQDVLEGKTEESIQKINQSEVILPKGDYELVVQELGAQGPVVPADVAVGDVASAVGGASAVSGVPTKIYSQPLTIGEEQLFFVAMGDGRLGYTMTRGKVEPVQQDDRFREGFWSEGRMAYYLKGKILGKYLVTSSFDTERERKEIFKKLDPDQYYPVYGDDSSVAYDATATQGNLYMLVEWDKSSATWGNYSVGFEDTEFADYTRSLYGGKISYESLGTTPYGDPRSKVVVFRAEAQQKASHNEFLATGGSLYYLKHKDVIEGSDKVRIEVRDKITGLVVSSREMDEGADYEMDYKSGRIVFWRPVPMLVDTYSIISSQLLDGNLVYVVADYEYEVLDKLNEATYGTRVKQAVTDSVVVGGTYVKEGQTTSDYELRGSDVTIHAGKDATIKAEYAETQSESLGSFASTDGGLSFTEIPVNDLADGRAYGITGDARLFNRVGLKGYYQWIDNDFSTGTTLAQQGKETTGVEAVFDITDKTRLTARHDIQQLIQDGNLQTQLQVGADRTMTSMLQIVHQIRKLTLTGEYQRQEVLDKLDQFASQTNVEKDAIALRADLEINDRLSLAAEQQINLTGNKEQQTTLGVTAKPLEGLEVKAQDTISQAGHAMEVGAKVDMTDKISLTGEYGWTSADQRIKNATTVGATAKVTEDSEIRGSVGLADVDGIRTTTTTVGGTTQVDQDTKIGTDIAMAQSGLTKSTTVSVGGEKQIDETTKTESKVGITDSSTDGKSTSYTFGTKKKLNEELQLATSRTFGFSPTKQTTDNQYSLIRDKNGKKLEGSLTQAYSTSEKDVSRSNIFGLSGGIDDRWALTGSFERGTVQNFDGSQTDRNALAAALGFVKDDAETGQSFKSSLKTELRMDSGSQDKRQYLVYSAVEGKLSPQLTIFTKMEFSKTKNVSTNQTEAQYKEMMIGAGYRPVYADRLNFLTRYTYLEDRPPEGQVDNADADRERSHVMAADVVYDLTQRWQVVEKFAYRISEEKVAGFDFNKTHTWLLIHRLNYKFSEDWLVGAEYRTLTQVEAQDSKRGFLVEGAKQINEYAQLGVGFNFSDFSDDLTELDYSTYGPYVRMTGSLFDQTPEEIARNKEKWLDERIEYWAWAMVEDELSDAKSPILKELNMYFALAKKAQEKGDIEQAQQLYKDIIMAGQMMYDEASEYIHGRVSKEEELKEMSVLADQYFKSGQYEKAKKILEKIVEEAK
jgi:hypothetical protein